MRLEGCLLSLAQPFGPAAPRPVVQALGTFGVEAQDGVVQRLPLHSGQPRRFSPRHAVERIGQRQQSQTGAMIPLARGALAQLSGRVVLTDRQRGHARTLRHRPHRNESPTQPQRNRVSNGLNGYKYIHTLDTALIMAADTIAGYIEGLLDGKEFKQTTYALDRGSRKAALARFLMKAAGEDEASPREQRPLAA